MSNKGSQWERDVCKYLSKWVQGSEKPYIYWRGHGSGAMFTNNELTGDIFAGDIYCLREEGKFLTDRFVIECKNGYPKITLDNHLKDIKDDKIRQFWFKAYSEGNTLNKYAILIYKKKGMKNPWIFICKDIYKKLNKYISSLQYVHLKYDERECYIFNLYEFFECISVDIIKKIGKRRN